MQTKEVAFLGPLGTYSHLVACKRFGTKVKMMPMATILDVCTYVTRHPASRGVVPIENSSGGAIYETVDILLARKPKIHIDQELSLDVKLALLGKKDRTIANLYSHFAPLEHCRPWIKKALPKANRLTETSTAVAASRAASDPSGASLGSRHLGRMYGLDVLLFPVEAEVDNITTFFVISASAKDAERSSKTTLAVRLPNVPGSLCNFLDVFRREDVNLSRLISRPIRGVHKEYEFLIDMEGGAHRAAVKRAIQCARKISVQLHVCGSYPCRGPYRS